MTRIREFLGRLLKLRNGLPLLIILAAFVGLFVDPPPSLGITREHIILALLGFLAVDALIERIEMLTKIETDIGELKNLAISPINAELFFHTRRRPLNWEDRLADVKTLDILGLSLRSLVDQTATLKSLVDSGAIIRVILSNPDNYHLQNEIALRIGNYADADHHAGVVRTSLRSFQAISGQELGAGMLQVRVCDYFPGFCYIGTDTDSPKGLISVELYLNNTPTPREDPIFFLRYAVDKHWFEEFKKQFEFFWKNSTEIEETQNGSAL